MSLLSRAAAGASAILFSAALAACGPRPAPAPGTGATLGSSGSTTPAPSTPAPVQEPVKLAQAFEREASPSATYAKTHDPHTYYMALAVTDLRDDKSSGKCTDSSVLSWLRKKIAPGAQDISIVGTISNPVGDTPVDVPLFAASKDETKAPPVCGTTVPDKVITAYYLTDRTHPFNVQVAAKATSTTNVRVVQEMTSALDTVLTYTGKNGNLIKLIGGNDVQKIAQAIDNSLTQNYSQVSTDKHLIQINAYPETASPTDDDWQKFKDAASFGAPAIRTTVWGPKLDNGVQPAFQLHPVYAASMFGEGRGHYMSADAVMGAQLLPGAQQKLRDLLLTGIQGFSTHNAQTITDPAALDQLCKDARLLFAQFLTDDDALAARYAMLQDATNYFYNATLRKAQACLSDTEKTTLAQLRADYVLPELATANTGRDDLVKARTQKVAHAILNAGAPGALTAITPDASRFQLVVSQDVANAFPSPPTGQTWGGMGQSALDQIPQLGVLRLGCGHAPNRQSAKMIAGVALTKASPKPIAVLMIFDNDDPASGSEKQEKPVLIGIKFVSMATAQDFMGAGNWTEDSCDLI